MVYIIGKLPEVNILGDAFVLLLLGVVGSVETDAMTVDETSRYRNEPAEDETEDNLNGEN